MTCFATEEPTMQFFDSPDGTTLHHMNTMQMQYSDSNETSANYGKNFTMKVVHIGVIW